MSIRSALASTSFRAGPAAVTAGVRRLASNSGTRTLPSRSRVALHIPTIRTFATSTPAWHPSQPLAQHKACHKCNETLPIDALACTQRQTLQPLPSELDAFQILGLRQSSIGRHGWSVDLNELKSIWRKRMALSHPDRMGGKDAKEQAIAAQQAAMINRAYQTLREPLLRVHLLLEHFASSAPSEAESLEDPEVLMEVMELREALEEAASEEEAAAVGERNQEHMQSTLAQIDQAFDQDPPDIDAARSAAVGLRYWSNIDKAAREWQPGKRVELQH